MPSRRKTYDGDFVRGSSGIAEWRDPVNNKGKTDKHAPSKRATKNARFLIPEDSLLQDDRDSDRYLITYADLITLLLGLFIILYAISNIDASKYQKMAAAMENLFGNEGKIVGMEKTTIIPAPQNNLSAELEKLIADYGYGNSINLEKSERGIIIHILDDLLFPSANAELNSASKTVLSRLAEILKKIPNNIRIEGHTDDVPIYSSLYPSNWHLSVARALNTAYYLIENEKLSPEKISIVGYSEYQPVADNSTPEGRASNRRVDIVIIKK